MRSDDEPWWATALLARSPYCCSSAAGGPNAEWLVVGGEGAMVLDWNCMGVVALAELSSAVKPEGPAAAAGLDSPASARRLIASSDGPSWGFSAAGGGAPGSFIVFVAIRVFRLHACV